MKKIFRIFMASLVLLGCSSVYASSDLYTEKQVVNLLEEMDESLHNYQMTQPGKTSWQVVTDDGLIGNVTVETVRKDGINTYGSGLDEYNFDPGSYSTTVTKDFLNGTFKVITDWDFISDMNLKITGVESYSKPPIGCEVISGDEIPDRKTGSWVRSTANTTWGLSSIRYTTETITKISYMPAGSSNIVVSWWT